MMEYCNSMEELSHESMRPDLDEAREAPKNIKHQLHYKDEEELETGMQKVQPLDVLDKEIERYRGDIKMAATTAPKSGVPAQVLNMLDQIIAMAKEGHTGVFKASQILEFIFDAFHYGEFASRDTFDLRRRCLGMLKEHDDTLKRVVVERFEAKMESAEKLMDDCYHKLDVAYKEAKDDLTRQGLRLQQDLDKMSAESLQELAKQAADIITVEKDELRSIEAQCKQDLTSIADGLDQLHHRMAQARDDYKCEEKKKTDELERNQKRQRELEEELRLLKARENQLKEEVTVGKDLQKSVDKTLEVSKENIAQWQENIADLERKTSTSLLIMDIMDKCTKVIMDDAIMRKHVWMKKLDDLKVEGLLALRDVVIATSIDHMTDMDDCAKNLEHITESVQVMEAEKMKAAQHGFSRKVKDLMGDLEAYDKDRLMYQQRRDMHKSKLDKLRAELGEIDNEIAAQCPDLVLDTLEGRFGRFMQARELAFSTRRGVLQYCSRAGYE